MSTLAQFRRLLMTAFHRAPLKTLVTRPRLLARRLEQLEDRITPTATLYVDFGDMFPGGTLNGTTGDYVNFANGPGLSTSSTPFNPADSLSIESFDSYIGADAASARASIMSRVREQYKPFDVTVVELTATPQNVNGHTVTAASSFSAMGNTLNINDGDAKHFDSYIVVGRFTIAGNSNLGYGGLAPGGNGNAINNDYSAMVPLYGASFAYTGDSISHEAGHTFGLRHVYQSGNAGQFGQDDIFYPGTGENANDFYIDDLMSYNSGKSPLAFFFRYPTLDGSNQHGDTFDSLSSTSAASTGLQLLQDPNIGPSNFEYVTGTGQDDVITITKTSSTSARVVVTAFRDAAHTQAIPVPGTNGATNDFVYDISLTKSLIIRTGSGADAVHIVGDLGVQIDSNLGGDPGDILDNPTTNNDTTGPNVLSGEFDGSAGTLSQVTVTFNEAMNKTSFGFANAFTVFDPNGNTVAITGVTSDASGQVVTITFDPQSSAGQYTIAVGANLTDVAGNQMDQNFNGIKGEADYAPNGDQFAATGTLGGTGDTTGANMGAEFFGATLDSFDTVRLTFNEIVTASTVDAGDITITGPNGPIAITGIDEVFSSGGTQFDVTFDPQFTPGSYSIDVGVDILDLAGNQMDQNQNGNNGEPGFDPTGDEYTTSATFGDVFDPYGAVITFAQFTGFATGTFDTVEIDFNEPIDASTLASNVSVFDPNFNFVPITGVTEIAGSNGTQFNLTFAPQTTPGEYTFEAGVDILDLFGNQMDQNYNGINGEPGFDPDGDEFTMTDSIGGGGFDPFGAVVLSAVFSGVATGSFDTVEITFDEPINASTLDAFTVSVFDQDFNSIPIDTITEVAGSGGTVFQVTFTPQFTSGDYTVDVYSKIQDLAGNPMDQNFNGINGEFGFDPFGDDFTTTETLIGGGGTDITGASITSAVFGGASAGTFDHVRFTFSEPLDPTAGFITFDVLSLTDPNGNAIPVTDVVSLGGINDTFDVTFAPQSTFGTYTIHVGSTMIDVAGNEMDQNQNGSNGEAGLDPFGDEFEASDDLTDGGGGGGDTTGAHITSAVFAGSTTSTFDHVRVTFSEPLDSGFGFITSDVLSITDPNGNDIPVTDVVPVGGTNTTFDVTFATQTLAGAYTIHLDNTMLDVAGNEMDQNQDGTNGELGIAPTGDEFSKTSTLTGGGGGGTGTIGPTTRVVVVGQSDGSIKILDGNTNEVLVPNFRPLDTPTSQYKSTVAVASGDLDGDGIPELFVAAQKRAGIAGLDASKAGKVFVYNAATIAATGSVTPSDTFTPFATNFDGTQAYETGFELATGDVNGDGTVDLVAASRGDVGQISVMSGVGSGTGHARLGSIVTPFGTNYRGKVAVTAGNFIAETGTQNDEVAAARGNTDSTSVSQPGTTTRVAMFDLVGSALNPVTFSGAISPEGIPSHIQGDAGQVIDRNAFVAAINLSGTGTDLLLFAARDFVSNPANPQIRVAVYGVNATGFANLQSSNADGDGGSFTAGNQVGSYAIARSDIDGNGADDLALVVDGPSAGVLYLAPLTGADLGGLTTAVLTGGVRITSS